MNILIVEDDRALGDGIALALKKETLNFSRAATVAEARAVFEHTPAALVILDLNLPDESGLTFLRWLRERSRVSVLILTANDLEIDEVTGLSLGADDYVTKPFSLAVLRARVEALLRRGNSESMDFAASTGGEALFGAGALPGGGGTAQRGEKFMFLDAVFDFAAQRFSVGEETVELTLSEQKLLRHFLENPGRLLLREQLYERLWGDENAVVDENALSVAVNRLRAKLGKKGVCIRTVYGQGYLWREEDTTAAGEPGDMTTGGTAMESGTAAGHSTTATTAGKAGM